MELLWLYYTGLKSSRYVLFLELGVRDGKMCGLDADKIKDSEKKKIINGVDGLSLGSAIRWIRANCPQVFRSAYRELVIERVRIESRHKIDPSKVM
jgi:hypothetical protein